MTPSELIPDFPLGPGDQHANRAAARILLLFLADHVHDATLKNGLVLRDRTDFDMWLRELAEGLRKVSPPLTFGNHRLRTSGRVVDQDWCPDCGHLHADPTECGFPIGGGRICLCDKKVPA